MITADDLDIIAQKARDDFALQPGLYGYSHFIRVSWNLPYYVQARALPRSSIRTGTRGTTVQFLLSHINSNGAGRRVSRAYLLRKFGQNTPE